MDASKIYLVTKADDVGSNDSAHRAFFDGYKQGILRNGVIMMTCSKAKEAAEFFKNEKGFCMGLHLTLNAEWDSVKWGPVLPPEKVPSIVDKNGHLFQTTQELHDNNPKVEHILAEMQAQLDLAREYGLDIKFADSHMGFTWVVEGLADKAREWARKNGIEWGSHKPWFKRLPEVDCDGDPVEKFLARLKAAEPGIYYMHFGHPAYDTPEMRALGHEGHPGDAVAVERDNDRRRLMDPRVVEYCKEHGVIPITFTQALELSKA